MNLSFSCVRFVLASHSSLKVIHLLHIGSWNLWFKFHERGKETHNECCVNFGCPVHRILLQPGDGAKAIFIDEQVSFPSTVLDTLLLVEYLVHALHITTAHDT